MCIAILQRSNSEDLDWDTFERCSQRNDDGMGLMWVENGEIKVWKSLDRLDLMFDKYKDLREKYNMPIALHFRNATKGEVTLDNCHPFFVNEDMAMMHNGTLSIKVDEKGKSDTLEFRDHILRNMPEGWIHDSEWRKMVNKYSGWSRFILTCSTGEFYVINEDEGYWVDNVWYSNNDFRSYSGKYYGKSGGKSTGGNRVLGNSSRKDSDDDDSGGGNGKTRIVSAGKGEGIPHGRFTGGFIYKGVPICPQCMPDNLKGDDDILDADDWFSLHGNDPLVCTSCNHMIYPSKYKEEKGA